MGQSSYWGLGRSSGTGMRGRGFLRGGRSMLDGEDMVMEGGEDSMPHAAGDGMADRSAGPSPEVWLDENTGDVVATIKHTDIVRGEGLWASTVSLSRCSVDSGFIHGWVVPTLLPKYRKISLSNDLRCHNCHANFCAHALLNLDPACVSAGS